MGGITTCEVEKLLKHAKLSILSCVTLVEIVGTKDLSSIGVIDENFEFPCLRRQVICFMQETETI